MARYVHNEYVQVAAQFGLVGAALLGVLLVALGWPVTRPPGPTATDRIARAAGVAVLAAVAVHGALDFVWHLPAVPLLVAALLGLAAPARPGRADEFPPPGSGQPVGVPGPDRPDPVFHPVPHSKEELP